MLINALIESPLLFILLALALILSITVHEFAHAYVANKLGDPTAKALGRVTLNPLAHMDPIGTLLLVFVGFGWGKPVPFDVTFLKNPKRDSALIAFAGPLSNFILALIIAFVLNMFKFDLPYLFGLNLIKPVLGYTAYFCFILGFFNLIPIYPLDGFRVVYGLLPRNLAIQWLQMERYGIYLLLILVISGKAGDLLRPLTSFAAKTLHL
ncbi:MAG: hypothetical protein ACD_24C00130G0003 [uncultured bacterium]|uniref:Peptidase M50 domain-containing protein n=1 Tax=candidate division WWE3 bacterium RBG_16_37_10 TaxID=1802610 RepID=A0A1F4UW95_UNCKA|nr:MAG: hypothetical protein ACD_24C00130G0003 [uncultured bacterium]OGC49215.1 MAG: hypothetical protein A2W32_00130 [candidate division WWE3 bacterium RBG_16_37_10]